MITVLTTCVDSNPIPDDIMDYVKMEVSATVVEVCCLQKHMFIRAP